MFITGIEPKGKTKITFYIRDEEAEESIFTLTRKKAAALGLPTDTESVTGDDHDAALSGEEKVISIPDPQWQEILSQLRSDALRRCGDLLGRQDYTRAGLAGKLEADGCPKKIREQVLDELTEAHYLDDRRLAENYIRGHLTDKSKARIRQDLLQKGISQTDLEEAFDAVSQETDMENQELTQIRRLLEKRHYDREQATWEEKQKTMAFLYRRGFSQDMIRRGMEAFIPADRQDAESASCFSEGDH